MALAATCRPGTTFRRPFQFRELIEQFWFVASVTILPAALVSIPFGAVIALQVGSLTQQLGAQSFTGGASVLAVIQQASPLIVALLIAGAGGSAICADLGSRKIREELDAMEVMGVSPIQRLVVPRVLAMMLVAVLLNGLVSVVGTGGGYFFNVIVQHGTPGRVPVQLLPPWPNCPTSTSARDQGADLRLHRRDRRRLPRTAPAKRRAQGRRRDAVNQSVVITFLLLFLVNVVLTAIYLQLDPQKGSLSDGPARQGTPPRAERGPEPTGPGSPRPAARLARLRPPGCAGSTRSPATTSSSTSPPCCGSRARSAATSRRYSGCCPRWPSAAAAWA